VLQWLTDILSSKSSLIGLHSLCGVGEYTACKIYAWQFYILLDLPGYLNIYLNIYSKNVYNCDFIIGMTQFFLHYLLCLCLLLAIINI